MGADFRGVFDRFGKQVHLFERTVGGAYRAPLEISDLDSPVVRERLDDATFAKTREEIEMLEMAGAPFDPAAVLRGELSPVFFGSAANNFGVQLLLDGFLKYSAAARRPDRAAPPAARGRTRGPAAGNRRCPPARSRHDGDGASAFLPPDAATFSGFVFKIQANMDPRHRDRIAFLRVCSGQFERDMAVTHLRTGKKVRLSSPQKLFAQEREIVDEAFPGDIVGLVGHDAFGIGDTLSDQDSFIYDEIPRFAPECFAYLRNPQTAKYKQFRQGLDQLLQEGVIQVFHLRDAVIEGAAAGGGRVRCSSRSCSTGCKASTARNRAWKPPRGTACAGCAPDFDPDRARRPEAAHRRGGRRGHRRAARAAVPERLVAAVLPRSATPAWPSIATPAREPGENRNVATAGKAMQRFGRQSLALTRHGPTPALNLLVTVRLPSGSARHDPPLPTVCCSLLLAATADAACRRRPVGARGQRWNVVKYEEPRLPDAAQRRGFLQAPVFPAERALGGALVARLHHPGRHGSKELIINGVKFIMSSDLVNQGGNILLSRLDLTKLVEPVLRPNRIRGRGSHPHGGHRPRPRRLRPRRDERLRLREGFRARRGSAAARRCCYGAACTSR